LRHPACITLSIKTPSITIICIEQCRITFIVVMLIVVMRNVIMLNVTMLNVAMLNVAMLNVVTLPVMAPLKYAKSYITGHYGIFNPRVSLNLGHL
jgi:hypothetical protein